MKLDLDMDKMEQKRYDRIKASKEYIEVNILIGVKPEKYDGHIGKMPVVTSSLHKCGSEEIANMYMVLKQMVEIYKEEYPEECLLAELTMECNHETNIITDYDNEEE